MRFITPKLLDCHNHGTGSELLIVEGDSAALALTRIRNEANQAILPMQGKPMNATRASAKELSNNVQFAALLNSLRIELKEDTTAIDLVGLPYDKFILLFDPDADGIHSRTLMLLFFYRWLRPLLVNGQVFDAHAPQWEISSRRMAQPAYATTKAQLEKLRNHLRNQGVEQTQSKRYRGLANVPATTISQLCVDPETCWLRPVGVHDAEAAIQIFDQLRIDASS